MKRYWYFMGLMAMTTLTAAAQNKTTENYNDSTIAGEHDLKGITVTAGGGMRRMPGAINGVSMGRAELFRAACCNLGESFVNNPSVDVSYTDAATGARQIKLLGLAGTYVQMLTETLPDFRGAALPYSLGYVPGTWMKSIQVSKGSSSVKNGYEAITGQINVEYLKPEDPEGLNINVYGDSKTRTEANIEGNLHLNKRLSTILMVHGENTFKEHDENNDGFYDKARVKQINLMNRWKYQGDRYIFHGGLSMLHEERDGGQMDHGQTETADHLYTINIRTHRYEGYMKHAYILNPGHNTNVALMTSASMHEQTALFGHKRYYVNEKNAYASLMFESDITPMHNISLGLSLNHDYLGQTINISPETGNEQETTPGAYAQYTFNAGQKLTSMAGVRVDHSSVYGTFVTPRFHVKYAPSELFTLRLSAGKGYRTVHALAENSNLLASGRRLVIAPNLNQEAAWNYGANAALLLPIGGKTLKFNAEYYYTDFARQAVIDYDSDPKVITIAGLDGRSYSHTVQVDATWPILSGLELTAAWRYTDARTTYGGRLLERPLTSRYKGLLSAQYKTPLEKWKFDVTLQLNGGGRMPQPYTMADGSRSWDERFKAFEQLSAQITREFRFGAVYVGGENLTGFRQQHPIIAADRPWSDEFEPTLVWGPVHGRMVYAGIRIRIDK